LSVLWERRRLCGGCTAWVCGSLRQIASRHAGPSRPLTVAELTSCCSAVLYSLILSSPASWDRSPGSTSGAARPGGSLQAAGTLAAACKCPLIAVLVGPLSLGESSSAPPDDAVSARQQTLEAVPTHVQGRRRRCAGAAAARVGNFRPTRGWRRLGSQAAARATLLAAAPPASCSQPGGSGRAARPTPTKSAARWLTPSHPSPHSSRFVCRALSRPRTSLAHYTCAHSTLHVHRHDAAGGRVRRAHPGAAKSLGLARKALPRSDTEMAVAHVSRLDSESVNA
jgi:hypothetical protein